MSSLVRTATTRYLAEAGVYDLEATEPTEPGVSTR